MLTRLASPCRTRRSAHRRRRAALLLEASEDGVGEGPVPAGGSAGGRAQHGRPQSVAGSVSRLGRALGRSGRRLRRAPRPRPRATATAKTKQSHRSGDQHAVHGPKVTVFRGLAAARAGRAVQRPSHDLLDFRRERPPSASSGPGQRPRRPVLAPQRRSGQARRRPSAAACPSGAIGQCAGIEVDLDIAAFQMPADELFGQRILDVALDGAAERPAPYERSLQVCSMIQSTTSEAQIQPDLRDRPGCRSAG